MGSGISGLAAAHQLNGQADVTLFESGDYFGGHTHTVDVTLPTPQRGGLLAIGFEDGATLPLPEYWIDWLLTPVGEASGRRVELTFGR